MSPFSHKLLLMGFLAGISCAVPTRIEAAFVCADLEVVQHNPLEETEQGASDVPEHPSTPDHAPKNLVNAPPTDGMSAPQTSTLAQNGSAFGALAFVDMEISAVLIARLGPEGRVWLPPPFSTGIFRPPRSRN